MEENKPVFKTVKCPKCGNKIIVADYYPQGYKEIYCAVCESKKPKPKLKPKPKQDYHDRNPYWMAKMIK